MRSTARLQLLICLMLYASSVQAIMVKFGTREGPIVPPAPEPELPPAQPYRSPAPVWEERANDAPDPNAHWRPQFFKPQLRYTQVVYSPPQAPPLNNAQRFVNSYIPRQHHPVPADQVNNNYIAPAQFLSSQSLPGYGLRYFVPNFINESQDRAKEHKKEDAKLNDINSNDVDEPAKESANDAQWKYEKESSKHNTRHTQEIASPLVYVWPAYVPPAHQ